MCLVGGLSENKYFQSRMKEEFGQNSPYKLAVVIPIRPILSVVDGAARMGIVGRYQKNPTQKNKFVFQRHKPKTYGIAITATVADAITMNHEIDTKKKDIWIKYITANRYVCPFTNGHRVANIFYPLFYKHQIYRCGERLGHTFSRMSVQQKEVEFMVYSTDIEDENDMLMIKKVPSKHEHIHSVTIPFPDNSEDLECIAEIDIDTEVIAYFYPASLGRDQMTRCILK